LVRARADLGTHIDSLDASMTRECGEFIRFSASS
jgi:hypothetical protein